MDEKNKVIEISSHDDIYELARSIIKSGKNIVGEKVRIIDTSTSELLDIIFTPDNKYVITKIKEGTYE